MTPAFDKVLIANRGEIAVRIIRTCKRLGYRTVAVYSDADREALHVRLADEAVSIGPAPAKDSYLAIDKILAAAERSGAQAVHPGYGFLSERTEFARAVQEAGLVFIGPDPASIQAMGNKSASKRLLLAAGVPCVPGYHGEDQRDDTLIAEAQRCGLPVMIKAAAGGGGRGMRLVHEAADLLANLQSARSEAQNAFGDGQLLIEKAVVDARHVEIQIFGDRQGHVVALGERDCSVQRRHQKLIEESPSPAVDEDLRARMSGAAVAAARAVNYIGAGTVEFLLARDGSFYFLEMNTRLQVEHPVTELVYCIDLVEWQLRVARGEALPMTPADILARRRGWAMEVRLCAEDAERDFLPQTGRVLVWRPAQGEGMRVDHGLCEGQRIEAHYDSMQAKLIAYGETRDAARRTLLQMLEETVLLGVTSNRDSLCRVLADDVFARGLATTNFLSERVLDGRSRPGSPHLALAGLLLHLDDARALQRRAGVDPGLCDWRNAPGTPTIVKLRQGSNDIVVTLRPCGRSEYAVQVQAPLVGAHVLSIDSPEAHRVSVHIDGLRRHADYARDGNTLWLAFESLCLRYEDVTYAPAVSPDRSADGRVLAPMDGKIVAVAAQTGAAARKGDTLVILEAMKMEFRLTAATDGTVTQLNCQVGQQVKARQLLVAIE